MIKPDDSLSSDLCAGRRVLSDICLRLGEEGGDRKGRAGRGRRRRGLGDEIAAREGLEATSDNLVHIGCLRKWLWK